MRVFPLLTENDVFTCASTTATPLMISAKATAAFHARVSMSLSPAKTHARAADCRAPPAPDEPSLTQEEKSQNN